MRRSTSTNEPLCSPARTMLIYKSENTRGCLAMASDRLLPSVTSCFNSRLTSAGIPLDSRWVMLFNATVNGMPDCSKLAICWVKVASSWSLGLRFWESCSRSVGGRNAIKSTLFAELLPLAATPAALAVSTATGNRPSRSIWVTAAERSATSRTPSTNSPLRRRAL